MYAFKKSIKGDVTYAACALFDSELDGFFFLLVCVGKNSHARSEHDVVWLQSK